MPDLESLLDRLVQHGVEFVIIGGFAAVAHGVSLVTQDIDICCSFNPENLFRLQSALEGLHPVHRMTPARLPLGLSPNLAKDLRNLYLDTDLGQLDCLSEVTGLGEYTAVLRASQSVAMPFGVCRILGIDALIRAKEAMNRPHDRAAVLQLRAIRERTRRSGLGAEGEGPPG